MTAGTGGREDHQSAAAGVEDRYHAMLDDMAVAGWILPNTSPAIPGRFKVWASWPSTPITTMALCGMIFVSYCSTAGTVLRLRSPAFLLVMAISTGRCRTGPDLEGPDHRGVDVRD